MNRFFLAAVAALLLAHLHVATVADAAAELKIAKGLKISIVGNTLAERMQHDGWMETILQSRFPDGQVPEVHARTDAETNSEIQGLI